MRLSRIITTSGLVSFSALALAGCSLPFMNKPTAGEPQGAVEQMANVVELSAMMSTGQAGTCRITDTSSPEQNTINIAVKGKKFLMQGTNFAINPQDPSQQKTDAKIGYMLNDTEYVYIWEDQATTGMKMKSPEPASAETPEMQEATKDLGPAPMTQDQSPLDTFQADPKFSIECQLTDVPDTALMPPASVTFMDLSQGMVNPAQMQQQALPQNLDAAGQ